MKIGLAVAMLFISIQVFGAVVPNAAQVPKQGPIRTVMVSGKIWPGETGKFLGKEWRNETGEVCFILTFSNGGMEIRCTGGLIPYQDFIDELPKGPVRILILRLNETRVVIYFLGSL